MKREISSVNTLHYSKGANSRTNVQKTIRFFYFTYKLSIPYHSQTSGQVEVSSRQIKLILEKTMSQKQKDWSTKLVDAL